MAQEFSIRASDGITDLEDVLRNLRNIFSIWRGSLPLNRNFGLNWAVLSSPTEDMQADFTLDVMEQVDTYEPRVQVTEVTYEINEQGKVIPTIYIEGAGDG